MVVGLGIDIVEVTRKAAALGRHGDRFVDRVFTDAEQAACGTRGDRILALAARFAAKEAIFKALGEVERNFVGWKNIEILNDGYGKPVVFWHGAAEKARKKRNLNGAVVSLSHTENYAVASAMLVFNPGKNKK